MNLKEQLKEKKAALIEMEPQLKAEDVSDETIAAGEALAAEIKTAVMICIAYVLLLIVESGDGFLNTFKNLIK